jgi:hypothetical protein
VEVPKRSINGITIHIHHRMRPVYDSCISQYIGQYISVDSGTHGVSSFLSFLVSTTKLASFMFRFERGLKPLPNEFSLNIIISV